MNLLLIISIAIRLIVMIWSIVLIKRLQDWRIFFVTVLVGLMGIRQFLTLLSERNLKVISITDYATELPGLLVSILALVAIFFLELIFVERKQAKKELYESEEKFRILYNNSPDMYVSISPEDGIIQLCNETLLKKTGYSKEEIIGFPIFKLYHDDCIDDVKKTIRIFNKTGEVKDEELIVKRKDGSKINVNLFAEAVRDGTGKILYSISSWRDITERKQVEIALNKSEARLSTLFSNLPGMAYQCKNDEHWTMLFVNDACEQLTGYKPEQLINNKDIAYNELIHPDDRVLVRQKVREALNAGKHFELEYRIISADGKEKWVWERGVQTDLYDSIHKLLEGVIHDITKRKQAEEELKKYREHLEEIVKERTKELKEKNAELERYNRLFEGREFRIKELKDRVKELGKNEK